MPTLQEHVYTFHALGCDCDIAIVSTDVPAADNAYLTIHNTVETYDHTFSRFRAESELSILNIAKEITPSERFYTVLQLAQILWRETHGAYNALVQIAQHGYTTSFDKLQHTAASGATGARADTNWAHVTITPDRITLGEHQRVDVAGLLKGYLAHILADTVMAYDAISGVIINLGGDIATRGTDSTGAAFTFDIFNPITEDTITVTLSEKSLATSGTYRRRWRGAGDAPHAPMRHHILSPDTQRNPSPDIISASVIHPDGARTDAYATAAIIMGHAKAVQFLSHAQCNFVLIAQDGTVTQNVR